MGYNVLSTAYFDTLTVDVESVPGKAASVLQTALACGINLRPIDDHRVGVTLDESVTLQDMMDLVNVFASAKHLPSVDPSRLQSPGPPSIPENLTRSSKFLTHPVFNSHHSETEMLRYIHALQNKDLSLCHSMIPLGSCTMKLNSTTSMIPLSWEEFSNVHPFAPLNQAEGYRRMIEVCQHRHFLSAVS